MLAQLVSPVEDACLPEGSFSSPSWPLGSLAGGAPDPCRACSACLSSAEAAGWLPGPCSPDTAHAGASACVCASCAAVPGDPPMLGECPCRGASGVRKLGGGTRLWGGCCAGAAGGVAGLGSSGASACPSGAGAFSVVGILPEACRLVVKWDPICTSMDACLSMLARMGPDACLLAPAARPRGSAAPASMMWGSSRACGGRYRSSSNVRKLHIWGVQHG